MTGTSTDRIEHHLANNLLVVEYRFVSESKARDRANGEGKYLYGVTVSGVTLAERLVRHGGRPESIVATSDGMVVTVDVPVGTNVLELVEMLEEPFGSAVLESRRTVERALQTKQEHVTAMVEPLTDRQLEVLRTAYFSGYYEWPREMTGEEVAELLGVSQPTVNRHL